MNRCVAILAGGASRRMGTDKAALRRGSATWLERTANAARDAGALVMIVGRTSAPGAHLDFARFVADDGPAIGPLGGLATALDHTPSDHVLAAACDMPNLTARAFSWLFGEAEARRLEDGVVPITSSVQTARGHARSNVLRYADTDRHGETEPLFAVYTTRCRPLVARHTAEGRRSMRALIDAGSFARVAPPRDVAGALVNVNTPADLAAYLAVHGAEVTT